MANVKISELTAATTLAATDQFEINASGTSKSATAQKVLDLAASATLTLTNKTLDTAGTGNSLKINGTAVSAVTGSGSVVLATSPTLVTPALGTPTAIVLTSATGLPLTTGVTGTLPVANGGTGATTLTGILKGAGTSAITAVTAPTGDIVGTTDTQTLTNKSLTSPIMSKAVLNDGYTEEVFAITDGASVSLDPNNGSIQTWTLGANRTPGQANWAAGQSITLLIDDGTAYTITWTTLAVTWKTNAGVAPTLNTSGYTVIVLWKVGTTIYGARVGDA